MVDATVQALACRRTQVVSLAYGDVDGHYWLRNPDGSGVNTHGFDSWHNMVHAYWDASSPQYLAADIGETMATADRWRHSQVARLLEGLRSTPEGDGTLLDHTVVLYMNEFGDATHVHSNIPFFIAGGSALGVNTGTWLEFDGEPHNRLYLSLLRAFGIQDQTFGEELFCGGGPLPGIIA
jgi:hypothetical protein